MNKKISPFKQFCITLGNLPTSYLESMSYYETLCWLCKYIENNINPAVNQNTEAIKELQEYVTNYFDNLDVTEEINNKLDEMADDGTLAEIINVEMIGTLSNLKTTDKSNLVNAINEIYPDGRLVNIKQYSLNELNVINGEVTYLNNCYLTWDNESNFFKIFGDFIIKNNGNGYNVFLPYPNGFTFRSGYIISMAGFLLLDGEYYDVAKIAITENGIQIYTDLQEEQTVRVILQPFMYYNGVIEN